MRSSPRGCWRRGTARGRGRWPEERETRWRHASTAWTRRRGWRPWHRCRVAPALAASAICRRMPASFNFRPRTSFAATTGTDRGASWRPWRLSVWGKKKQRKKGREGKTGEQVRAGEELGQGLGVLSTEDTASCPGVRHGDSVVWRRRAGESEQVRSLQGRRSRFAKTPWLLLGYIPYGPTGLLGI